MRPFPCCPALSHDERQCWLKPGHTGKHLITPVTVTLVKSTRVVWRIIHARPDVSNVAIVKALGGELLGF